MAIASTGYAGSVNAAQWARMGRYHGSLYAVRDRTALACARIGTTKTFSISAGEAYGFAVMDTNDTAVTIAPTVPGSGGRWFLIVLRRKWSTRTTTIETIGHTTTTTTTPTAPPNTLPAAFLSNPGVEDDQPLHWVWVNASNTNVAIVDLRDLPASTPKRGTVTDRDTLYPVQTFIQGLQYQLAGVEFFDTTLGCTARYYAAYDATTNPGGYPVAGWYLDAGTGPSMPAIESGTSTGVVTPSTTTGTSRTSVSINNTVATRGYLGNYGWVARFIADVIASASGNAAGYAALYDAATGGSMIRRGSRVANMGVTQTQIESSVLAHILVPPGVTTTLGLALIHEGGGVAWNYGATWLNIERV